MNNTTSNNSSIVVLDAPAKVTLSLHVTGTRPDGYHLLDAEMVTIDLADKISIDPSAEHTSIVVSGPYAEGVPTDGANLVAKALTMCGRTAAVTIDKQIPHGGGLGGGSTDAAAILRWAGFDDPTMASTIGADVPFCMVGGRAKVTGIGEGVAPLPYARADLTLVIPPLSVSTPTVYQRFDQLRPEAIALAERNHLEPAAIEVVPELAIWRDKIARLSGTQPVLAGSGATWFVHGKHGNALAALDNEGAQIIEAVTTPAL